MELSSEQKTSIDIAQFLFEAGALHCEAIDISKRSDIADCMVIACIESQARIEGLYRQTIEHILSYGIRMKQKMKHIDKSGWLILDCGHIIIHLMLKKLWEFYELGNLWFDGIQLCVFHAQAEKTH